MARQPPKFVKTRDIANDLGVCMKTVKRWTAAGHISAALRGPTGHAFYHRDTLDKLVARNKPRT
jgi:predicted site-specific integrase-resolvase